MTTLTDTQVITASGGLVELGYTERTSDLTVTGTTFPATQSVNGPLTFVSDGSPVMIEWWNSSASIAASSQVVTSLFVDGAEYSRYFGQFYNAATATAYHGLGMCQRRVTLSAGSHTVEVKAMVSSGTGVLFANNTTTAGPPTFLRVSKIVQATQWPAVTTGTIICTSSTRPASPFEGQRIYQTDDKRELVYNGSAWVTTTPVGAYTVTTGTTTSTSYTSTLTSGGTNPSVTLNTGTSALVSIGASSFNSSTVVGNWVSVAISGATTIAASDDNSVLYDTSNANYLVSTSLTFVLTGLTAGSNTFALNYRTTGGTASFRRRSLVVQGLP